MRDRIAETAMEIVENARTIEAAGAFSCKIKAMPHNVGKALVDAVSIFTVSISSGSAGTCQLSNGYNLLGASDSFSSKIAKRYATISDIPTKAFAEYAQEVQSDQCPTADHSYKKESG